MLYPAHYDIYIFLFCDSLCSDSDGSAAEEKYVYFNFFSSVKIILCSMLCSEQERFVWLDANGNYYYLYKQ